MRRLLSNALVMSAIRRAGTPCHFEKFLGVRGMPCCIARKKAAVCPLEEKEASVVPSSGAIVGFGLRSSPLEHPCGADEAHFRG
jgi:hypothetical protein